MTPRERKLEELLIECYDIEDEIMVLTSELDRLQREKSRIADMSETEYRQYISADKSE